MARGKKKETLTTEERLQAALVPENEQPYKVPGNWCWLTQNSIATFLNGRAYKQDELLEDSTNTPVLRVGNLFTNSSWYYSNLELDSDKYIDNGDLIYAWSASFGPFIWDGNRVIYHYHIWKVLLSSAIRKKYMYFWLLYDTERLKQGGHGTGMIHVTKAMMEAAPIPLPSIYEQQRIVDRIESLFAKLDEAKQKAQDALDSFETRKAAILHKAFTGELTAQWRKEHGVGMESWETHKLVECFEIVSGIQKTPARSPKDNPVPYLAVANVYRDKIDLSDIRYFEVTPEELEKLKLQDKDILIVEGNGSGNEIGRCAMWHNELPLCIHQNHIIRMRNNTADVLPEYVLYYLNSQAGKSVMQERAKTTAGLFNLSAGKVKTIPLPFASLDEQIEIVRILDDLLVKEQQAKEAAEGVLEQIDLIKKAILARAFRGELGTNDPSEESAVELLSSKI